MSHACPCEKTRQTLEYFKAEAFRTRNLDKDLPQIQAHSAHNNSRGIIMDMGVTLSDAPFGDKAWNVVGHTYTPKLHSPNAFIWHAHIPAETFVPPHIHTTQDEWIYMLAGNLEVEFGHDSGEVSVHPAGLGDLVRMPMGKSHGIFNRSGAEATCVFGVAPARKLFDLFGQLDGVTDPEELVRLSAMHEVDFLPPPPDAQ